MNPIRVILADDHAVVRAGLRAMLEEIEGVDVVGEAGDGRDALALVQRLEPDILLTDIAMPGMTGLDLVGRLAKSHPKVRVIIVSMHLNKEYISEAMNAGAAGYLLKDAGPAELELALAAAAKGEIYLSPAVSKRMITEYQIRTRTGPSSEGLSPRQREILQMIAQGFSTKEIARKLGRSPKTVETHRSQLMERLGINDIASLVRYAIRIGLVTPEE